VSLGPNVIDLEQAFNSVQFVLWYLPAGGLVKMWNGLEGEVKAMVPEELTVMLEAPVGCVEVWLCQALLK